MIHSAYGRPPCSVTFLSSHSVQGRIVPAIYGLSRGSEVRSFVDFARAAFEALPILEFAAYGCPALRLPHACLTFDAVLSVISWKLPSSPGKRSSSWCPKLRYYLSLDSLRICQPLERIVRICSRANAGGGKPEPVLQDCHC